MLWTALATPVEVLASFCVLGVPVVLASACGSIASIANEGSLRRHASLVHVLLAVTLLVGVLLFVLGGTSRETQTLVALMTLGWVIFFWVTCWRTASVARKTGLLQLGASTAS